jgi:hypothetical protein
MYNWVVPPLDQKIPTIPFVSKLERVQSMDVKSTNECCNFCDGSRIGCTQHCSQSCHCPSRYHSKCDPLFRCCKNLLLSFMTPVHLDNQGQVLPLFPLKTEFLDPFQKMQLQLHPSKKCCKPLPRTPSRLFHLWRVYTRCVSTQSSAPLGHVSAQKYGGNSDANAHFSGHNHTRLRLKRATTAETPLKAFYSKLYPRQYLLTFICLVSVITTFTTIINADDR